MKLLLCCENYPPSVGGVQEVMRQVAERLAARGHDVTVHTGAHRSRPASAVVAGVRVESFEVTGNLAGGVRGEADRYRDSVLAGGYDAVLVKAAQQWSFDALLPILDRLPSRKVLIPCGFSGLHERAWADYYSRMPGWLRAFDELIFYSGTYRDIAFARAHGLDRLHVVPNGVDEREFAPPANPAARAALGIGPDDFMLLSVGTLVAGKGHWEVLKAYELARLPGPSTLVINGNDPYADAGRRLRKVLAHVRTARLPLEWLASGLNRRQRDHKRVLLANLPRPSLVRAYGAADLFVFASAVEYSPLVLFEAAAAGTPFVSSPAGNAREIAEWTGGGWIYEAPTDRAGRAVVDPRVLASELERCRAMGGALEAVGRHARRRVLDGGYTWEAIVPRYEAILAGRTAVAGDR